jgi:hypothetical protein
MSRLKLWSTLHARNQALIDKALRNKLAVKSFRFKGSLYDVIRTTDYELFFFRGKNFVKSPPKELKKRARRLFADDDVQLIHES